MADNINENKVYKVFTIDKCICNYLSESYLQPESNRYYADNANISETIIRKIKSDIGYRIPLSTLKKITDSLDKTLSILIKDVEDKYAKDLKHEYHYYEEISKDKFIKMSRKEVEIYKAKKREDRNRKKK